MASETIQNEDMLPCSHLRTKMFYISGGRTLEETTESGPTSQYWCLKTMMVVGPEGKLATPENCVSGCGCYNC
ncbi:MAG TPA: hypothetical protein VFC63_22410 [Blastocatellia bacterium]|nr:hypothetical protein [Blastocatellia bacterium]